LAHYIRNGSAIAVSNGSYKDNFGMAACIMQSHDGFERIIGKTIAPGGASCHSPYRSELTGIYTVLMFASKLCSYYDVMQGSIEIPCDGLSALNRSFSYVAVLSPDEPSYALLSAIRHLWQHSPISWKTRHI
jgi:hypothetical protein